jgi:hypothetical protein
MKTLNTVKQAIKHLTRENFKTYPDDWENGEICENQDW